ncbi:MAG: lipoprotein [Gammaproteobacteria bacterium]
MLAALTREQELPPMPRPRPLILLLLALLLGTAVTTLAGCGQKGDLYLPEEPPAQDEGEDEDA